MVAHRPHTNVADYWRAVAMLRLDRSRGLAELERAFAVGGSPRELEGPRRGRLIATTTGYGVDRAFESIARVWMPWKGKAFAPELGCGRNLFTPGGSTAIRVAFPGYRGASSDDTGPTAFRFTTDVGSSETHHGTEVLRIDYRNLEENPTWPVRRILDELVRIEDELYLGQALMLWRGRFRRVAWFSLEGWQHTPAEVV